MTKNQDHPWWFKPVQGVAYLGGAMLFLYGITGGNYEAGLMHWLIFVYVFFSLAIMLHLAGDDN